jgi:hypothetical protein
MRDFARISGDDEMYLYHYFDKTIGPFVNLSDLPIDEAKTIMDKIKKEKPAVQ